jgi:single-stranded-DNA-specific exonuclease
MPVSHPRLFLGVSRSVLERPWRDRLDAPGLARAEALGQIEGLPDVLARVLAGRGVTPQELASYLEPRLRDLMPDPDSLTDMAAAAGRLAQAVKTGERVAIFGDYDVDGACSSALLAEGLARLGASASMPPPRIYIPDRITEGYGPNSEAVRLLADEGATLLVMVDCGTTSLEPVAEANALGLDVLVLDHHQAPVELPAARAVVNPNRQDDLSGLGTLCAAGVVFITLIALHRALRRTGYFASRPEPNLLNDLDLVALATVADVVPLTGLNRAFVKQGLAVMRGRTRPGLNALVDVAGLAGPLAPWHLGFALGPRINAGGRIGDASLGARLLMEGDETTAARMAGELDGLNRARQDIERLAVEEGMTQAQAQIDADIDVPIVLVSSPDWHPGVVGLVAARLKERFNRPAFALALNEDGRATGSARSIIGADIGRALRAAVESGLALKGGGHAMAAGVTLDGAQIEPFRAAMAQALARDVATSRDADALLIDAAITAGGIRPGLVAELDKAGPFGQGCPEPVFALPSHRIVEAAIVGAGGHLRFKARSGDGATVGGVAFRAAASPLGQAMLAARGEVLHLAGTLSVDRWGGGERAELRLMDAARPAGR